MQAGAVIARALAATEIPSSHPKLKKIPNAERRKVHLRLLDHYDLPNQGYIPYPQVNADAL